MKSDCTADILYFNFLRKWVHTVLDALETQGFKVTDEFTDQMRLSGRVIDFKYQSYGVKNKVCTI